VRRPGSGKSALGKLIPGLFEPQTRQILIDGCSLQARARERLSNIVVSVDQDLHPFGRTVHDNVTLRDDTIDNNRLITASGASERPIEAEVAE
jgi:ATP-binding cassette subfamily B protein